ncbi:MAG: hypothetical protein MSG64_04950 [Pyrinomonadaceae bacterium MAG19_C2-C3]|nr:hypothetical protein [Pyrinomonadaceae bacterium MAG19_C2-C3]
MRLDLAACIFKLASVSGERRIAKLVRITPAREQSLCHPNQTCANATARTALRRKTCASRGKSFVVEDERNKTGCNIEVRSEDERL